MEVPEVNSNTRFNLALKAHKRHVDRLASVLRNSGAKSKGWRVFTNVALGLHRIDVVVLDPSRFIQLWEVDDGLFEQEWQLVLGGSDVRLKSVDRDRLENEGKADRAQPRIKNSVSRLYHFRRHLIAWYLPQIAARLQKGQRGAWKSLQLGIYAPSETTEEVEERLKDFKYISKKGSDFAKVDKVEDFLYKGVTEFWPSYVSTRSYVLPKANWMSMIS
jgi:hypothetical protein